MDEYSRLMNCVQSIREKTNFIPKISVVLGSGLGFFADNIQIIASIAYKDIQGFPLSTVEGHRGRLLLGYLENVPVCVFQGRVHYYEGYSIQDTVVSVRVARLLGAKVVILTNSAGGIAAELNPGDLMLITDHISSFMPSPLRGINLSELGTRFPDMSHIYDEQLCKIAHACCSKNGISLKEGIYIQVPGPNYETPAEIKMYQTLGAACVGMSTACEACAACHAGLHVCGISCISNLAAGLADNQLSHQEVQLTAERMSLKVITLLTGIVKEAGKIYD